MTDQLLLIAHALGHPVRLHVLRLLGEDGLGVTAVADAAGIAKATAAHHLYVLAGAGLVERVEYRNWVRYRWGEIRWQLRGERRRRVPPPSGSTTL